MSMRQLDLLERDRAGVQAFVDEFDPPANGEDRVAEIHGGGELLTVTNFPLPDGLEPDYVDLLLVLSDYPSRPPIGIYLLERENAALISQLRRIFNVMNHAVYTAPTLEGFQWICVHYQGNTWKYNASHVTAGDNLRKFLIHFYNRLYSELGG